MSSEMRHALRTPLNQILGYVDLVTEDAQDAGATTILPDLARIKSAALDLLGQVEAISPSAMPEPFEEPEEEASGGELDFLNAFAPPEESAEGRLLVVDDDPNNRDVLARTLEKKGYTVSQAADGAEALDALATDGLIETVLLDILMPGMNGWETLQRLKANPALKNLPVIMISGLGETDAVVRCLELGAEDYVQKPFVPTILKARVKASVEKKRARDREEELYRKLEESYRELREFMASEESI